MDYGFAKYGDWTDFCDEHVLMVREIPEIEGGAFECLKVVPHIDDDHTLCMLHEVIFTADFTFTNRLGEEQLNQQLQSFGYKDLDDYVRDMNGDKDWIYKEDGSVDRHASTSWSINWSHLVSLVCESHDHGLKVTPEDAKHTVQRITHVDIPRDFFLALAGCEMEPLLLDHKIKSASIRASGSHSSEQQPVKTPSFER